MGKNTDGQYAIERVVKHYVLVFQKLGYALGLGLMISGVILLILHAVDYLAGWSVLPTGFTINGIFLCMLGLFIAMKYKK